MDADTTCDELKVKLKYTSLSLKFFITGVLLIYVCLVNLAWRCVMEFALAGGGAMYEVNPDHSAMAVIFMFYYASTLIIDSAVIIITVLPFWFLWHDDVNNFIKTTRSHVISYIAFRKERINK